MTGESGDPVAPAPEREDARILLAVEDDSNRRLLGEFLGQHHEVVDGTPDDAGEYDICVADVAGFREVRPLLEGRRTRDAPEFLPCLLVVSEETTPPARPGGTGILSRLDGEEFVDDVIATPVRKAELRRRTDSLLRIRELSLSLRQQEEQYRRLVELTPETILLLRDGAIAYANRAGESLLAEEGRSAASLVDEGFLEFVAPDDRPEVESFLTRIRDGDAPSEYLTVTLVTPTGPAIVEVAGTPVTYGGECAVQLVVRDVTEREEREQRLRLNQRAMDEASIGITIADAGQEDLPLLYANPAFERITGYTTVGRGESPASGRFHCFTARLML